MNGQLTREYISILIESPLYMTMSVRERQDLIERIMITYPLLCREESAEADA